jgi:hypothetical protein
MQNMMMACQLVLLFWPPRRAGVGNCTQRRRAQGSGNLSQTTHYLFSFQASLTISCVKASNSVGALDVNRRQHPEENEHEEFNNPTVSIDPSLTGFPSDTGLKATTITKP